MIESVRKWFDIRRYSDRIDQALYVLAWILRLPFPFMLYWTLVHPPEFQTRAIVGNVLALLVSFVPRLMDGRSAYRFPAVGECAVVFALLMEMIGRTFNLYEGSGIPYDKFSHAAIVGALTTFAILLLYAFFLEHRVDYDGWFVFVIGILFGLGIGALWECYEWGADLLIGSNFQKSNFDTMSDMVVGAIGAFLGTAAAREYRLRHTPEQIKDELPIFYEWL